MSNPLPTVSLNPLQKIFFVATVFLVPPFALAKTKAISNQPLQAIERRIGGRLGVVAIDVKSGRRFEHRSDERFLMCSTFKLALVGHLLKRIDSGDERLDRQVAYSSSDLLEYAPVTSKHVSGGRMSIKDLGRAVLQYSDNTAANLLLRTQGGPAGLTKFLRDIGDSETRLDRIEPQLNAPTVANDLDTTTPSAMAETVRRLVLEDVLSVKSRALLKEWLLSNATADARFRAGVPKDWNVADKGGTGDQGATNDIGVLFTPKGDAIILTAFSSGSKKPRQEIEAALAEIARLTVKELTKEGR